MLTTAKIVIMALTILQVAELMIASSWSSSSPSSFKEDSFQDDAASAIQLPGMETYTSPNQSQHSTMTSEIIITLFATAACWIFLQRRFTPKPQSKESETTKDVDMTDTPKAEDSEESQVCKQLSLMQKYAAECDISSTMKQLHLIEQSSVALTSTMYNIVLQAWSNCGNIQAAEDWMDQALEVGLADQESFKILIGALVRARALNQAKDRLKEMQESGLQVPPEVFDDLLQGLIQEGCYDDGLALLEDMQRRSVPPTTSTKCMIFKLLNSSRKVDHSLRRMKRLLVTYDLESLAHEKAAVSESCTMSASSGPAPVPRFAAVIAQAEQNSSAPCLHQVRITGGLAQIRTVRKTLKQQGFLDKTEEDAQPLDGHWETDHGLTVVVEGKIVRWSGQRASRLRYTKEDRSSCIMRLYGEDVNGRVTSTAITPDASKSLSWDNGEFWHSYDGRVIGQDTLFSQCMSKPKRDAVQDSLYQAQFTGILKTLCKQSLGIPSILEDRITQFVGSELFYLHLCFASSWNPSKVDEDELPMLDADSDICSFLSRRHPRVGIRHCWAESAIDRCGQRTLISGDEVDECRFRQHIGAICWS
jgi:pentatricopeptide repeat protein